MSISQLRRLVLCCFALFVATSTLPGNAIAQEKIFDSSSSLISAVEVDGNGEATSISVRDPGGTTKFDVSSLKSESRKALVKLVGLSGKVKITYTGDNPKKASSFEFTLELVSAVEDKFTNQMLSELAEILTK